MSDWIDVCDLEDVPLLGSRVLKTGTIDIAVFRTSTNEVYALENKCPHKGGPLSEGLVHGKQVTCPLHSRVLNLDNGTVVAPDVGCVRTFATRVNEGRIKLKVTDKG